MKPSSFRLAKWPLAFDKIAKHSFIMTSKKLTDATKGNRHRNKVKTIKKIYTPRPGGCSDTDEDESYVDHQEPPYWHRHFEADELLPHYEPIRELGTFSLS